MTFHLGPVKGTITITIGADTETGTSIGGNPTDPNEPTDPVDPAPPYTGEFTASPLAITGPIAFRTSTLAHGQTDVKSIALVTQPTHGHVSVNPDNTFALALAGTTAIPGTADSFTCDVTYGDNTTQRKTISYTLKNLPQADPVNGWGPGLHYLLRTAADGFSIFEPGPGHDDVYISKGADGLSATQIAQIEGLAASDITGAWLKAQDVYGRSEAYPLNTALGWAMWNSIVSIGVPKSGWLWLKRGHSYIGTEIQLKRWRGLSPIHPIMIRGWGTGTLPQFPWFIMNKNPYIDVVFKDVWLAHGAAAELPSGEDHRNIMYEGVLVKSDGDLTQVFDHQGKMLLEQVCFLQMDSIQGLTLRHSFFLDSALSEPRPVVKRNTNGAVVWEGNDNRRLVFYTQRTHGMLMDACFLDHGGWAEGYHTESLGSYPHAPSQYTHNAYFSELPAANGPRRSKDFKFRDLISMRSSSHGIKNQCGGIYQRTAWIDNNSGLMVLGDSNYAWLDELVVTSAGAKHSRCQWVKPDGTVVNQHIAARAWTGNWSDCHSERLMIVSHGRNPANANEPQLGAPVGPPDGSFLKDDTINITGIAEKITPGGGNPYFLDAILWGWFNKPDEFHGDFALAQASAAQRDATTIQNFARDVLGLTGDSSVPALAAYLRTLPTVASVARAINKYFQEGHGRYVAPREVAKTLRFVPDPRSNGSDWDDRVNWSTQDVPGTVPGDSAHLGGNRVTYVWNSTIADLTVGPFGRLLVWGGYLQLLGDVLGAANIVIDNAGQFVMNGRTSGALLTLAALDGRFVNKGAFGGACNLLASGTAEVLLAEAAGVAASYTVAAGRTLEIAGDGGFVGFDGSGSAAASLTVNGKLRFSGRLGSVREFRSGRRGLVAPNVASAVTLNGTLELAPSAQQANVKIIDVDAFTGSPSVVVLGPWDVTLTKSATGITASTAPGSGQVSKNW